MSKRYHLDLTPLETDCLEDTLREALDRAYVAASDIGKAMNTQEARDIRALERVLAKVVKA